MKIIFVLSVLLFLAATIQPHPQNALLSGEVRGVPGKDHYGRRGLRRKDIFGRFVTQTRQMVVATCV